MGMFEATQQTQGCKKLIAAVVAQAVEDSMLPPVKNSRGKMIYRSEAINAIEFLMDRASWCFHFLDIDQDQFCTRLVNRMFDRKSEDEFKHNQRAAFRLNYQEYLRLHVGQGESE